MHPSICTLLDMLHGIGLAHNRQQSAGNGGKGQELIDQNATALGFLNSAARFNLCA